ncbi:alpha/beta hydrolase [Rhizobium sp. NPDC090275]|uniref:alpha/beta hydrolase n=1 Tax=Rhizobium sp. NPDC090275 TaxID=3364498 RepID=UPI00383AEED5
MRIIFLFVLLALSSCTRPGPETLTLVSRHTGQKTVTILVASVRVPSHTVPYAFTAGRADRLRYLKVTVAIPPGHKPPNIEWPKGTPDPTKAFAVVGREELSQAQFVAETRSEGAAGIFVHGYNYNYQEALYRLAQITADSGMTGSPILFDWPSQASITGYVADRDSAAFARDDLVSVLTVLGQSNVKTTMLAHSMGAWLAVESIRQLSLMGRRDVLRKVTQLILAAPDIDVDLLRKQLAATQPLSQPIVILASKDDMALSLSKRLAGSAATAGSLDIAEPRTKMLAKENNLEIIDISSLPSLEGTNHDRFAALAAVYPQLQNTGEPNPVAGTGALVLNGAGAIVSAPLRIGGTILAK